MSLTQTAVIVGIGPGLGRSVALRFARGGFDVALMARGREHIESVAGEARDAGRNALAVPVDATDPAEVARAFSSVRDALGDPSVLIYNAGQFQPGGVLEIDPDAFERNWRTNCYGAFLAAREVLPAMRDGGHGSVIFTGASAAMRGSARFAALAVGKFGLRALAQSMAREFGPLGVHVAHAVIDGQIATPRSRERYPGRNEGSFLSPDAIAETYWQLHQQHRSAWTLELDLRPAVEKF